MTAELPRESLVTPEEYLSGEQRTKTRHEYVNGLVYAMAGTKLQHSRIVSAMDRSLGNRLDGSPCEPVTADVKVKIDVCGDVRFYYPDLYVICDQADGDLVAHGDPVLIIEVISESTRRIDEGEKLHGYLKLQSLQLYLIVEVEKPFVVAHRRTGDLFRRETYSGRSAAIPLPFLETELPLAEMYARVKFDAAD